MAVTAIDAVMIAGKPTVSISSAYSTVSIPNRRMQEAIVAGNGGNPLGRFAIHRDSSRPAKTVVRACAH